MKFYSLSLEVHVYTWVNVNLNLAKRDFLVFPKIHVFLLKENEPSYALPLLIPFFF